MSVVHKTAARDGTEMSVRSARQFEEPAAGAAMLITRLAIALLVIVAPLAAVGSRRVIYVLVPVGVALTLVAWLLAPGARGPRELRDALFSVPGLTTLFFIGWAGLSLIWTPFAVGPSERFVKALTTGLLVAVAAALLPERTKTSNLYLLPIGATAVAGAIAGVALYTRLKTGLLPDPEVSVLDRAALGLGLVVWPALGALVIREKQSAAIALALIVAVATLIVGGMLALCALAAGALACAFAWSQPKRAGQILAIAGAVLVMASPLLALGLASLVPSNAAPSFSAALNVWSDILHKDGFRLVTGHGFDSAQRAVAAGYLPLTIPRSLFFELWFELGFVGAAAAAALVARAFLFAGNTAPAVAPFLIGGLVAMLVMACFGLGIAPIWWVTLLALNAFAYALVAKGQFRTRRPGAGELSRG